MTTIGLRPATAADKEFCFRLHKAAMGDIVASIWGWDEQDQRDHHMRVFDPGNTRIVTADGVDVGMLSVDHGPTEIYLGRIEIHPDYQGRGIGTHLISGLLDQAGRRGQDLILDVLAVNHRAHALYQRLGLKEMARHGDGDIKIRMRYSGRPTADPGGESVSDAVGDPDP